MEQMQPPWTPARESLPPPASLPSPPPLLQVHPSPSSLSPLPPSPSNRSKDPHPNPNPNPQPRHHDGGPSHPGRPVRQPDRRPRRPKIPPPKNRTHLPKIPKPQTARRPHSPLPLPSSPAPPRPAAPGDGADPRRRALAAALPGGRAEQPMEDIRQHHCPLRAVLHPLRVRQDIRGGVPHRRGLRDPHQAHRRFRGPREEGKGEEMGVSAEPKEESAAAGAAAAEEAAGGKEDKAAAVSCSICLDVVLAAGGERATARLQCGHEFHLDCIGSAFNAKGVMQCPNCRKIEKGNWLYANGSRSAHDINMEEWAHDEDLYDLNYSDVPFRFHWCPFGRLAQLPSLFEEGESSPPVTFHDFMGQHVFTEQVAVSAAPGTTHPCPYVAYLHPLPPLTSSSSSHVPERTMDRPTYHDHWNPLAGPSDVRPMQSVQPADFHHNHWAHMPHSYAQPNSNNEQPGIPFGTRAARVDGDSQRRASVVSPSYFSNGSGSRSRTPNVPPLMPQFMRAHGSISEQYQQNSSSSLFAGAHRSGGMRPAPAPLPENPTFSLFPPGSSGHNSMETDDVGGSRFYAWERDRFAPYPLMPVDCETSWWTSQQPHSTSEPASAPRRLFGQWLGVGRSSPENRSPEGSSYRQLHSPRM